MADDIAHDLAAIAATAVPAVASLFLGPAGGAVVGKIADIAMQVFGTNEASKITEAMQNDQQKADAFKTALAALVASDQGQTATNTAEANSPIFFVAGWRPFIGWVCGFGLAYQFLALPLLTWVLAVIAVITGKQAPPLPPVDIASLLTLVGGMLGLGTLRYMDKKAGVDTTDIQKPKVSPFKLFK
jgi:hypothetical protein